MYLGRWLVEPVDEDLRVFYWCLFECMRRPEVREGDWRLETCRPAWPGNLTNGQFLVTSWQAGERRLVTAVNYGPSQAQCYVSLGMTGLPGRQFRLADLLSE